VDEAAAAYRAVLARRPRHTGALARLSGAVGASCGDPPGPGDG
jgi:hypothetical protein